MTIDFDPFAGPAFAKSAPSTEPQREIFSAVQMGPDASCAFNESVSLVFTGALDVTALGAAVKQLVDRHESLRSTFSRDGTTLFVQPLGSLVPELALIDISSLADEQREDHLQGLLAREVETPFDLENGPLLRTVLVKLTGDTHQLLITAHHIVVDGWSMGVILRDLGALYSAAHAGRDSPLDAAPSFVQYARNEREAESSESYAQASRYWLEVFSSAAPALDLPMDRRRPVLKTYASRRIDFPLPSALTDKIRKAGARLGASYFVTLLAGFAATLHRLTSQDDLVIGIPAAGQAAAGEQNLVGHGVNMLPLRFAIRDGMTFSDLVKATRTAMLDGSEHQRLSFGALLKQLAFQRDPSRLPLTSVLFNVDKAPQGQELGFSGVEVRFLSNPRHFENFELFINAAETRGETVVETQYNTDLFDHETVMRWLSGMRLLLEAAAAAPDSRLDSLSILTGEDKARIEGWNMTAAPFERNATFQELFEAQADRRADATAIRFQGVDLTYGALDRRANQIAQALRKAGARAGTLIGLCVERSPDMVAAMLGILKAGGAYVPLDPAYPKDRLGFMIENSGMPLLLTTRELQGVVASGTTKIVTLEETQSEPQTRILEKTTDAEQPAYVIYTSGSTGTPKGVCVPHRAVSNFISAIQARPGIRENEQLVAVTTLSFDIAVLEIHVPLATGACVVLASREETQDGALLLPLVEQATVMQATPATWRLLLAAGWKGRPQAQGPLSGFRALVGGEALPKDLADQLTGCVAELWNMYGPTETTVWSTCQRIRPGQPITIGKPIANTTIEILDARLNRQPVGVVGELHIGGDGVTLGYLHRPDLTAERFIADPFRPGQSLYKTGDLARWLPSGELECLGRNDNQVKLRGFRIELGEIEDVLNQHPAVKQAAVIKREDRPGDQRLVGYMTFHADMSASTTELRAHLKKRLPEYMIPQGFVTLAKMPLTPNGKIDRKSLPAPAAADSVQREDFVAPRTPSEELVATLWREVLGLSSVSVDDDFFALGGHSLLASQILARLRRDHGVELSFRKMFEAPTIAQFAALVESSGSTATRYVPIPRREGSGPAPTSLSQERMVLLEQLEPGRAVAHNLPAAWRLLGPLDIPALQRTLDAIVQRHETLRTTFRFEDGRPIQVIHPAAPQPLPIVDLRGHSGADRERAAIAFGDARTLEPADFAKGPLFRSWLLLLGDDDHVLFIIPHNTIWDGWSFDLFLKELAAHYPAFAAGGVPTPPELPIAYADYAAWQRASLTEPQFMRQVEFWRRQLAGPPPTLEIPLDHPRPRVNEHRGADEVMQFSQAEVEALTALGRAHGATLFMVLFAGYNALLHRVTGETDLAIGAPTRARSLPEFEDLIGPFVNSIVLRTQVGDTLEFGQLVERVRDVTLEAFNYQDMPLETLGAKPPIVRNYFSLQDARSRPLQIGSLSLSQVYVLPPAAQADTMIWFKERKEGLMAILNYNTAIFESSTAARLLRGLRTLLLQAVKTPSATVGELPVMAAEDLAAADALSVTKGRELSGETVVDVLGRSPESVALAAALAGAGLTPGGRVGLHLAAGPDLLTGLAGTLRAGGVAASLDVTCSAEALRSQVLHAGLAIIVTRLEQRDDVEGLAPTIICLDALPAPGTAATGAPAASDPALLLPVPGAAGTSWAAVSHLYVANLLAALADAGVVTATDTVASLNPAGHELAMLEALIAGSSGLVTAPDADDPMEALDLPSVTLALIPASRLESLVAAGWAGNPRLKIVAVGAPPSVAVQQALPGACAALWHAWGHPSAGPVLTLRRVQSADERALIGRPISGIRLDVLDSRARPQPQGAIGPLRASGAVFAAPVTLATRARWTADGQLEAAPDDGSEAFHRGWRFAPAQIENALESHEAVARAAVEVRHGSGGKEELVAYIVRRGSEEFTSTELRRHLRRSFPRHLVPSTVVEVDTLPELAPGIIDRSRLQALDPGRGPRFIPPSTPSELVIATLWKDALGLGSVSTTDRFFDLGGYSLLCFQLIERIERQTGKRLHPRSFVVDTLGQLAGQLD